MWSVFVGGCRFLSGLVIFEETSVFLKKHDFFKKWPKGPPFFVKIRRHCFTFLKVYDFVYHIIHRYEHASGCTLHVLFFMFYNRYFINKLARMNGIFWKPWTPVLQNIDGYEKTRHFFKTWLFVKSVIVTRHFFPKIKILSGVVVFQKIRGLIFLKIFWGKNNPKFLKF